MVAAIEEITINQGVDPRERAGRRRRRRRRAERSSPIAARARLPRVLVPRDGRRAERLRRPALRHRQRVQRQPVRHATPSDFDFAGRQRRAGDSPARGLALRRTARRALDRRCQREYFVEARYPYQVWELEVPLEPAGSRRRRRRAAARGASTTRTSACSRSREPGSASSVMAGGRAAAARWAALGSTKLARARDGDCRGAARARPAGLLRRASASVADAVLLGRRSSAPGDHASTGPRSSSRADDHDRRSLRAAVAPSPTWATTSSTSTRPSAKRTRDRPREHQ